MNLRYRQRGAAAVAVTLLMLFVLALVVGFAHRNLVFEQRSSANQLRSTQAFEAAEAGLEWALAMLNSPAPIDEDCAPGTAPGDTDFRNRFLAYDAATQQFAPRSWNNDGSPAPLQAACVLGADGWSCSCPAAGHPLLDAPGVTGAHPAFALRFVAVPRSGMVQVVATGCDHFAAACLPGLAVTPGSGASSRAQVTLALLPALAGVPSAALTARSTIAADGALGLINTDARSGGRTALAGGSIGLPAANLTTLAGAAPAASLVPHDATLAGIDAARLFVRLFGVDHTRWTQLPGVRRLHCAADCTAGLLAAIGPDSTHPVQWVDNDLLLSGPVTLGTAEQPVLLVVDGQIRLGGDVTVHGAIVSLAAAWDTGTTAEAQVHGAVVALGDVVGSGTPTVRYDPDVLARLHGQVGSFARVPGSWRDH